MRHGCGPAGSADSPAIAGRAAVPSRAIAPRGAQSRPGCATGASLIQVYGNTHGLKASQVKQLERLFDRRIPADQLLTNEFARNLTEISADIRRQVGVLVDRRGQIAHVMVGSPSSIEMPDWGRLRAGRGRLRGLRCIHTTLTGDGLSRDDLTDLALLRLDMMAVIEVLDSGLPGLTHSAALRPSNEAGEMTETFEARHPAELDLDFQQFIRDLEAELAATTQAQEVGGAEKALLVSVSAGRDRQTLDVHTDELRELARSAGVEVVDVVVQSRPKVDPKTVIGRGKLEDVVIRCFQ